MGFSRQEYWSGLPFLLQETSGVTGKFGLGVQNEAGQKLIEFCQENTLVIANTLLQQDKGRLYTWTSPDGQHWNQRLWHSHKAEIDVFLELFCFFNDPTDVGNLIYGSSAFSKSSLNIWKFSVHVLLKPGLQNYEHYFASMWGECNCVVVWTFFVLPFFGTGMKTDFFQYWGHCWVFQIFWHIECCTFTASSFKIWNSSTGVPSPPLACL